MVHGLDLANQPPSPGLHSRAHLSEQWVALSPESSSSVTRTLGGLGGSSAIGCLTHGKLAFPPVMKCNKSVLLRNGLMGFLV